MVGERERERLKFTKSMEELLNKLLLVNKAQYYKYILHITTTVFYSFI